MNNIERAIDKMNLNILKIENVPESYSSEVCRIVLEDNKRVILKIPFTKNKLLKEYTMLRLLQDKFPVPKILEYWEGDEKTPGALLLSYIEGKTMTKKINGKLSYQLGMLLGKFHSIEVLRDELEQIESLMFKPNDEWWSTIKKWFDNCIGECMDSIDRDLLERSIDLFNTYYKDLPQPDHPTFVHMDFRPGNILVHKNKINGILDFESCRVGSADIDFAKVKIYIWDKYKGTKDQFIKGYEEIRPLPNLSKTLPLYLLFDALAGVSWCIKRNKIKDEFYKENIERLEKIVEDN